MKDTGRLLKVMLRIAIIAVIAVIGFSMAACDTGSGPGGGHALIGTWTKSGGSLTIEPDYPPASNHIMINYVSYKISGNAVTSWDGSSVTFNFTLSNNNNTLDITNSGNFQGNDINGTWTRQ